MRLKAVCFDAAGTLLDTVAPIGESYASFANRYGVKVTSAEIEERFHRTFSSSPPLAFEEVPESRLRELERGWWKNLVRKIFEAHGPFPRFEDCFAELFTFFGKTESWRLYPETEETLRVLKERGLILIVISNFDSRLLAILKGLGIDSRFASVVLSSRTGHAKPSPEIFHSALRLHGLKGNDTMHVGDSLENDVLGAARAGLKAVWLNRNGKPGKESLTQVRNLREILPLVDQK